MAAVVGTQPTLPRTTASSSSTLVEHFRPSFATSTNTQGMPPPDSPEAVPAASASLWAQRHSASFGSIADQITSASQALAAVEASVGPSAETKPSADTMASLAAHLVAIERNQQRFAEELDALRSEVGRKGRVTDKTVGVEEEPRAPEPPLSDLAQDMQELQKKVDRLAETVRLEQTRLYARLRNTTMTSNKTLVAAPPMANGKTPVNFPGSKGEFEHMTKERYELILKSYDQPIKGDTAAKRQAVREFLGLPPDF